MNKLNALLFVFLIFFTFYAEAQSSFHLIEKIFIGGDGGWDYLSVNEPNDKLYVSHSTCVEVIDIISHKKIGTIPDLKGVHGVIAVPGSGRGITTNGHSNTATIFDLKTLKVIAELPTGKNPDALLYDKFSNRVFIFNHSDVTATAINIVEAKVVGIVHIGGTALEAGVSDEQGTIFVNLEDTHEVVSFDAKSLVVKNKWKVAPGEEPTGLAIDRKNHRLFSVCHNGVMMVLDSDKGSVVAEVPIGKRVDGVVFDADLGVAISSNGEGTMTVVKEISPNEFKVTETVSTAVGARTIALNPKTHHVFVSTAQYGEIPAATTENPNPRPKILPGTFSVYEYGIK
ncbi:MAG: YncE family protein [Bacteroidetes bacterium]|nr:YncE family protein [Bacteroidota bacterium]